MMIRQDVSAPLACRFGLVGRRTFLPLVGLLLRRHFRHYLSLRRERQCTRSAERLREPREHALQYDADLIVERYWLPFLRHVEQRTPVRAPELRAHDLSLAGASA